MDEIDAAFDKVEKEYDRIAKELVDLVQKTVKDAMPKLFVKIGKKQTEIITRIFNENVDAFYADYIPTQYSRNESLYDVLKIRYQSGEKAGLVDYGGFENGGLYDSSKMTTGRNGEPLFGTVFKLGYHGGARGISSGLSDVWGTHPASGVAYYRAGGWVKYPGSSVKRWHRYGRWGRQAEQADKSIYQMMIEDLDDAAAGEMTVEFQKIAEDVIYGELSKIQPKINSYLNKLSSL